MSDAQAARAGTLRRATRARAAWSVALGALAIGVVGLWASRTGTAPVARIQPPPAPARVEQPDAASAPPPLVGETTTALAGSAALVDVVVPAAPAVASDPALPPHGAHTPPPRVSRTDRPRGPNAATGTTAQSEPVASASPPEPPRSGATGVVAIGGDGAQRAEILVDGVRQGFAPRALTLPVGAHSLRLVRPDGQLLGPETIEVGTQHTASAPLRMRFQ